ncbi:hypothetical protein [Paenibacillus methanolicus]|uniref:Uncharacterized protein n=1 Tax=Paenibacillus methanolicus TaxID=582686 RepID=A0A5S5CF97_9BACL|nr:hypothetical protein [Paenibacillus methanolicus]TYP78081.1 hypothetical protein BCM02_102658 [Paenibacillus methanolicus]
MIKSRISTHRFRVGKNSYVVINIHQTTAARTEIGNALASNAVNVQIMKQAKGRRAK